MDTADVRAALDGASRAGPYFTLHEPAVGTNWLPLHTLLADPASLAERSDAARAALRTGTGHPVEQRAFASVEQLGLVARLVSSSLAITAMSGLVAAIDSRTVVCNPAADGPLPIALLPVTGSRIGTAGEGADALTRGMLAGVTADVVGSYARTFRLSRVVLWGNVASALAGAAAEIQRSGLPVEFDPVDIVSALFLRRPLLGLGRFDGMGRFTRRTCCLLYRFPSGRTCGDCVLASADGR